MKYNFDEIINRKHTNCIKYDCCEPIFGTNDVFPMWVADMDFRVADFIMDALKNRLNHPIFGYFDHSEGFYNSIIEWMEKRHNWNIKKEWLCFSPGICTAISVIIHALTNPNDKIIIQTPVYHPFGNIINELNRKAVRNPLYIDNDLYKMDFADLECKLKDNAKMLILSNPHNPVGRCWTPEELTKLAELCLKYNCILLSDEIHSDIIIDGYKHTAVSTLSDKIANNTITCMSPSKTFNIAGLSTSEIIIPNKDIYDKVNNYLTNSLHLMGNVFGDTALEAAYKYGSDWVDELNLYLTRNANTCIEYIKSNLPMLKTYKHQATYLLWVNFKGLNLTHQQLNSLLINKAKLGLNDGLIFGQEGECFMRINYACPRKLLIQALDNLKTAINENC